MILSIYFQTMDWPKCSNLFIKFFLGPLLRENLDVRRIRISLERELTIALSCGMIEKAFRSCPEKTQLFLHGYGFRPHVSNENDQWKRNFSKTLSRVERFENAVFSCTCGQTKTELFENAVFRVRVDKRKRNFSKTLRTKYQFQSTPHNIRNLLKVAEGRFPFLSFIIGLISNLITCFQANLALLILQADYSRRRQNIIRLLSLPVSRGGRLDLPLVWLCFCPDFDILNCFCDFKERYNNINPHQRNSKVASIYYFAGS